ncbi:hypothetical protein C9756_14720, partial [Listeria monocytogenes]
REQWEKLGLGLDYSRERFTLDDGLSDAVKKVFVTLYNKGLINFVLGVHRRNEDTFKLRWW